MPSTPAVQRALISVFDKTGIVEFARGLADLGIEIISTGSTAQHIAKAGIPVIPVEEVTGFPEMMDGRVKTLHPRIHGAILADRFEASHHASLAEHDITPIDLVIVNLYPFSQTIANPDTTTAQAIEMIDIGGPTMVRAAAKNHAHVGIVVSTDDYEAILAELAEDHALSLATKRTLAAKAFAHTAAYDACVAQWFSGIDEVHPQLAVGTNAAADDANALAMDTANAIAGASGDVYDEAERVFPETLELAFTRHDILRYGENPHQLAAMYVPGQGSAPFEVLGGKALSYNNLVDAHAAYAMVNDFTQPCIGIIKHTNPAGLAVAPTLAEAYAKALSGDPVSAFGGVVAANREIDEATASQIAAIFTEVVIAPAISADALAILQGKKNLRIVVTGPGGLADASGLQLSSVMGGLLAQQRDLRGVVREDWQVVSRVHPDEAMLDELAFAWMACKHVKSNAIVLTKDTQVVGVGAGQMSRVDSVDIAIKKSGERHVGSVLASDAFFPFADGPELAIQAGIVAMISPGGSVRDQEVIDLCDAHGMPMIFTGTRHFKH